MTEDSLVHLLIVDPNPNHFFFYKSLLIENGQQLPSFEMIYEKDLKGALTRLEKNEYALIILNLYLPDCVGIETFEKIIPFSSKSALIVVTEYADENLALEVMERGAEDYLARSEITPKHFIRSLKYALVRQKVRENLREQSFTDELTAVYNRRGFIALSQQHLALAKRTNKGFHIFLIDMDHLKGINDNYGHLEGDSALQIASQCIQNSFRATDVIGRIGGDEFAILAINTTPEIGIALDEILQKTIAAYNEQSRKLYEISLSIGYAYFNPEVPESIQSLFEKADKHLYEKKKQLYKRR